MSLETKLVLAFTSFPSSPIAPNQAPVDHGCLSLLGVKTSRLADRELTLINEWRPITKGSGAFTVRACFPRNDCCDVRIARQVLGRGLTALERRHRSVCCDWLISAVSV